MVDRSFLDRAQKGMRAWWALMEEHGTRRNLPMTPQVPAWSLNEAMAPDAIACGDSGTVTTWAARQIKIRRGQSFSFVKFAEARGARGVRIDDPATCAEQLDQALGWDGPVIVECGVDQHEPPMPAKVKKEQAQKLLEALRAGTPNHNRIALQMVKDVLDEAGFAAAPVRAVPGRIGQAASGIIGRLRDRAQNEHPE
ncbi:thiamine pyrophosphate-dependent enzyme [Actinoallomurus sp. NPDC052274]|uniref:thiamine pyrophosphate-dependent enzyme n=1 Tax=Actinoallomurus sp. NPDC052274 TaxID=3155420 RepID=UPI00343E0235